MLKNWIKILLYNLKRSKLFTILTVVGLSIGICATILASLYWKEEHRYDQWNPGKDVIYEVLMDMGENKIWSTNVGPLASQMKDASSDIVDFMYYNGWVYSYSFKINGNVKTVDAYTVQGNFFNFFPFAITKGNKQDFEDKKQTIALSVEEAESLFGKENPIGKVVVNEENKSYTVTTVYKIENQSTFTPKAVINDMQVNEDDWNNFNYQLLIKVKEPNAVPAVQKATESIIQKYLVENYAQKRGITTAAYKEKYGDIKPIFAALTEARLFTKNSGLPNHGGNYKLLIINVVVSVLILVLSIVNQINLSTAYALKRLKEFGIRRIVGASRQHIILQLLFETSLYILAAVFLGFAMVEILLPYYNDLLQHHLQFNIIHNAWYVLLIFLVIIVSSALLPALYVSNIDIQHAVKNKMNLKRNHGISRQYLLILQFVISFLFICLGVVIYKQVDYMMSKDLGFKGDQVISISFYNYEKTDRYAYYERIAAQLRGIKGVQEVAGSNMSIGYGSPQSSPMFYKDSHVQTHITYCGYDLLPLLSIEILEGRNFDEHIASDSIDNVILNETMVNELGIIDPIHKTIKWNNAMYTIVGVVKDFNVTGFTEKSKPNMFIRGGSQTYIRNSINNIFVKLDAADTEKTIARIAQYWNTNVDPHYPFEYDFIDKQFQRTYVDYVKQRNLFILLNITVISIALFGLFSLASFSIEKRLKEIAIKKVLGANSKELILDLTKRYIWICVISFLIAIVPSYYIIQEWLSNFTYRIEIDYLLFLFAFLLMFLLVSVVVISKGYTATRINPLNYLKYE